MKKKVIDWLSKYDNCICIAKGYNNRMLLNRHK